ncbi:TolC family protein, partial [Deinococcus marmoris]|uniref:TolC family protein n=1 Tax=Deinococcus marmoris TaxID=249408 RepID=UPI00096AA342
MTRRFPTLFLSALLSLGLLGAGHAQTAPPPAPAPTAPTPTPPAPTAPTPPPLQQTSADPAQVQTAPFTLNDVLALLRGSPGWQSADLTYRAAQLALDSARTRAGLSLSVGADGNLTRVPWDTGEWQGSTTLNVSAALNVLPWSPAREAVRSAERALAAAAVDLRNSRATLTIQAAQAFAGARSAVTGVAQADAQLALSVRLRAVADEQRTQNLITAEAVLERQSALESAQAARDKAVRGVNLAAAQLTRVLGRPLALPGDLSSFGSLPNLAPSSDLNTLLSRALSARPEIAKAEAALADAQAALAAAQRDARLPDLTAGVRAGQLSDAKGNAGRTVSGSLNSRTGVLGVQVSLPLKDTGEIPSGVALSLSGTYTLLGGAGAGELAQASQGVQQAQLGLSSARQGVDLDVRTRLSDYQDEVGGLTSLQTALTRAQTAFASARARVDAGLATPLDIEQAALGVTQAQNAIDAQAAAVELAALQLLQATGELDPVLLGQIPLLPLTPPPAPLPTPPVPTPPIATPSVPVP